MVFQNYALYPHMSVAENMGFALKIAGVSKAEIDSRVRDGGEDPRSEAFLERKPKALWGGQRQRVAMGRAIVRAAAGVPHGRAAVEPRRQAAGLDPDPDASLQRRLDITTVYVTHDQVEAMTMGDRVAVMKDGVLQQVDTPLNLYDKPKNLFVAGFIGSPSMNIGTFAVVDGHATLGDAQVPLAR